MSHDAYNNRQYPSTTQREPAPRRLTLREMRIVLAIEEDLNDRRGLHVSGLDAFVRREIRQAFKAIVRNPPIGFMAQYSRQRRADVP